MVIPYLLGACLTIYWESFVDMGKGGKVVFCIAEIWGPGRLFHS